jgi:hypothetical protein
MSLTLCWPYHTFCSIMLDRSVPFILHEDPIRNALRCAQMRCLLVHPLAASFNGKSI